MEYGVIGRLESDVMCAVYAMIWQNERIVRSSVVVIPPLLDSLQARRHVPTMGHNSKHVEAVFLFKDGKVYKF